MFMILLLWPYTHHCVDSTNVNGLMPLTLANHKGEELRDGDRDYLGHTSEVFHMLEADHDIPILGYVSYQPLSVQGRLREDARFWEEKLEVSSLVVEIVTTGYRLPFILFPPPLFARNHKSASEHSIFVHDSIEELV